MVPEWKQECVFGASDSAICETLAIADFCSSLVNLTYAASFDTIACSRARSGLSSARRQHVYLEIDRLLSGFHACGAIIVHLFVTVCAIFCPERQLS